MLHIFTLPEPVFAYRALENAYIISKNEREVKATVSKFILSAMSGQQKKVMKGILSMYHLKSNLHQL